MRLILFIMLISTTFTYAEFTKSGSIVRDSTTKMKWQDSKNLVKASWEDAILYCKALSLNGYKDWRLPTIEELNTLIDDTKAKDTIFSPFIPTSETFWSATPVNNDKIFAWSVNFSDSITQQNVLRTTALAIKCVRGGK